MTESELPRPPGVHRRDSSGNRLAVLLVSLVCIAIVASLVVLALHKRGEPRRNSAVAPATPTAATRTPSATGPALPSSSPASTSPATSPAAPVASSGEVTPVDSPPGLGSESPAAAVVLPALDVLNDSRISGLAARASAQFKAAGWKVATVGNFKGADDVPATTIFYPDGQQAAAQRLGAAFGVTRLLVAPSGMSSTNLTVVLARDWPDAG